MFDYGILKPLLIGNSCYAYVGGNSGDGSCSRNGGDRNDYGYENDESEIDRNTNSFSF